MSLETVTFEEVCRRGWVKPGSIILTSRPGWWVANAIKAFQSFATGNPTIWQHAMRGVDAETGTVISQDWRVVKRPLSGWAGAHVRIYDPPDDYTPEQIDTLVEESELALGRKYDWLGILGQAGAWLPLVGDWWRRYVQLPFRTYCSEFICLIERKVRAFAGEHKTCRIAPPEIDKACKAQGRRVRTFILAA